MPFPRWRVSLTTKTRSTRCPRMKRSLTSGLTSPLLCTWTARPRSRYPSYEPNTCSSLYTTFRIGESCSSKRTTGWSTRAACACSGTASSLSWLSSRLRPLSLAVKSGTCPRPWTISSTSLPHQGQRTCNLHRLPWQR